MARTLDHSVMPYCLSSPLSNVETAHIERHGGSRQHL